MSVLRNAINKRMSIIKIEIKDKGDCLEQGLKNEAIQRIISLIRNYSEQVHGEPFEICLANVWDGCVGTEQKLRLTLIYMGKGPSQTVSECLPMDDILAVHEAVRKFIEDAKVQATFRA